MDTTRPDVVKFLTGMALGRDVDERTTTITFSWPVSKQLVACSLCCCVVQQADSRAHAEWHGKVLHVGPTAAAPAVTEGEGK